jgi:hypothetical protein
MAGASPAVEFSKVIGETGESELILVLRCGFSRLLEKVKF